jgi:hypothetical protein
MITNYIRSTTVAPKINVIACILTISPLIFSPFIYSSIAKPQESPKSSLEYKIHGSQASVHIDVNSNAGNLTATVTIRRGTLEKQIALIEANVDSLHGRKVAFPTSLGSSSISSVDASPIATDFTSSGSLSDSLARGGLPNRYLLVSVPETADFDRLVMIDLQSAEVDLGNQRQFHFQQILVRKDSVDIQRTYSVKSVAPAERSKATNRISVGGTLLSIADVDKEGKIATFGTGLVVHQMFFLTDKNFTNLSQFQNPLALRNDHSFEIVDKATGTVGFRSLGIHHTPRQLPEFKVGEGRIDPASRFAGPIHPQIIEVINRQGSNGILALPYLPLSTRNAQPIANLFDSFSQEYRADLTIEQAALVPKVEISNRPSVESIRDAILVKSTVASESTSTRKGLRIRQEKGLAVLQTISAQFPPALEAIKSIAESAEADATLRSMAKSAAISVERETKQSPKSLKIYQDLVTEAQDSSRCVRAFVPVSNN